MFTINCTSLLLVLVLVLISHSCSAHITIASRRVQSGKWVISDPHPAELISFKILLKQQNLDKLEAIFWGVSNPTSDNYGNFLTQSAIADLVAPEKSSLDRVIEWIKLAGISQSSIIIFSDFIKVTTDVRSASNLFSTEFKYYTSLSTGNRRLRISGDALVPAHLIADIDFIVGISELIDDSKSNPRRENCVQSDADQIITPAALKAYYGIPQNLTGSNITTQGVAGFQDNFSLGALHAFNTFFNISSINVTRMGYDCLNQSCGKDDSDLDIQYITSIATGVPTTFIAFPTDEWVLDWAQQVNTMPNPPLVNSISYAWPELEQCELTDECSVLGYNSKQYVTRTDDEFKKLGSIGVTVLVSSGDDGAPAYQGSSGNCPLDSSTYCPVGGCNHTSTACGEFIVMANNSYCYFPMAANGDTCIHFLQNKNFIPSLQLWAQSNAVCKLDIETDEKGNPNVYSVCNCSQLKGGNYNGFYFAPYAFNATDSAVFSAAYPTSSPYVTSVSATQFLWDGNTVKSEVAASILTNAKITTGGGFSSFQFQPSYQSTAVNAYLKSGTKLPPSFAYNMSFRAYPDISFNGHNFLIFVSNNSANPDACPCKQALVDGTSASSPSLAGLFSLINTQLLNANLTSLGFVNPTLYDMALSNPKAFTDITSGNNRCNRAYCCEYGWNTAPGWDPVTGLGTPVFPQFMQYIMNAKSQSSIGFIQDNR